MRVGAVMMQRNEGSLFSAWWRVHALIFGAENLFVLDNESDDPETMTLLNEARAHGVNVLTGFRDFSTKGPDASRIINALMGDFDWLFPLDCDEFVCLLRGSEFLGQEGIKAELSRRAGNHTLRVSRSVWNIPGSSLGYFKQCTKLIVAPGREVRLDHGFHRGGYGRKGALKLEATDIGHVHLHNRPFARLLEASRAKMRTRLANFSEETLRGYSGNGHHVIRYFSMTEAQYLAGLPKGEVDLTPIFAPAGLAVPFSQAGVPGREELALELDQRDA